MRYCLVDCGKLRMQREQSRLMRTAHNAPPEHCFAYLGVCDAPQAALGEDCDST